MFIPESADNLDIVVNRVSWVYEQFTKKQWLFNTKRINYNSDKEFHNLSFAREGATKFSYENGECDIIDTGSLYLRSNYNMNHISTGHKIPYSYICINFTTTPEGAFIPENKKPIIVYPNNPSVVERLFLKALDIFIEKPITWELEIKAIIYEIISLIVKINHKEEKKRVMPKIILDATKQIENDCFTKTLSTSLLAKEFNVSTEYFIRLFKSVHGITPKQYILNLHLQRAIELLKNTSKSIGEISELSGFSDIVSFNRKFKEKFHTSPSEYRKNIEIY